MWISPKEVGGGGNPGPDSLYPTACGLNVSRPLVVGLSVHALGLASGQRGCLRKHISHGYIATTLSALGGVQNRAANRKSIPPTRP